MSTNSSRLITNDVNKVSYQLVNQEFKCLFVMNLD
jgi:hypothetical protein